MEKGEVVEEDLARGVFESGDIVVGAKFEVGGSTPVAGPGSAGWAAERSTKLNRHVMIVECPFLMSGKAYTVG